MVQTSLKLHYYQSHEKQKNGDVLISEVADHDDWKVVRDDLIKNTGITFVTC